MNLSIDLYMQVIGSTLEEFEIIHREYSNVSIVESSEVITYLHEDEGYVPFKVTINKDKEFMSHPTVLPGVYQLLPIHILFIEPIKSIKIHSSIKMEASYLKLLIYIPNANDELELVFDETKKTEDWFTSDF